MTQRSPHSAARSQGVNPSDNLGHTGVSAFYSHEKLVLMERGPRWVHTYWGIAPKRLLHASRVLGSCGHILLRLRDRQSRRVIKEREVYHLSGRGRARMALHFADHALFRGDGICSRWA